MLEFDAKMQPYEMFLGSANLGVDAAKDDIKKHVLRSRMTKLEVMCARIVVKPKLKDSKKTELLSEQTGAFAKDLHVWGIQHPVLATAVWKPLWTVIEGYLPKTST